MLYSLFILSAPVEMSVTNYDILKAKEKTKTKPKPEPVKASPVKKTKEKKKNPVRTLKDALSDVRSSLFNLFIICGAVEDFNLL